MAEIVNLKHAKKAKARAVADETAAANRLQYGTPKPLRDLTKARSEKASRDLEGRRIERDKGLKD